MGIGLAEVGFVGVLFAALNVPLACGWVPRNRMYGFRVPATLRSDTVWYTINRRYGRKGIVVGALLALLAILLDATGFDTPAGRLGATIVLASSLLTLTVLGWRDANRLARGA